MDDRNLVRRLEEIESGAAPRPIEKKAEAPKSLPPASKVEVPPKMEAVQAPPPPKTEALKPTPAPVQMETATPKVEVAIPPIPPIPQGPPTPVSKMEAQPVEQARAQKNRYDTLLRFAAVELEGSLKKDF